MSKLILPIGTIVKLKKSKTKVMILGYLMKREDGYIYDYCGCEYPKGMTGKDNNLYFNRCDITNVIALGYINEKAIKLMEKIEKIKA